MFSGSIEIDHRHEMGLTTILYFRLYVMVARFGIIYAIYETRKAPMEECYF